jgi:protease PrsW
VLPPILYVVFARSEKAVGAWLGQGFDADTEMLELINSGHLSDSPVGQYLHSLKSLLKGPAVADVLCYLQLYTELALRAKGILMMRENGFDVPVDEETKAKFAEMRYLEQSIGRTALLAIQPMLHMSHKDLWQLYMLGK